MHACMHQIPITCDTKDRYAHDSKISAAKTVSIPLLPIDHVDHLLPLLAPIQIHLEHLERPIRVRFAQPADVRRDDAVRRVPQRAVLGQRFRVRHVERRASEAASAVASVEGVVVLVGFEGGDEVGLHDDLPAGDV